ncbi:hypothetical protein [Flavobacterium chungbukense]|uniref:Secreted protein n=1 Tax=Flavobacterium chungbukense TaxID=877464 RepID=A0ABP7Y0L3_9FLAO|nr:hypothetical protein [Flavobacterium chungbukense]MCC4922127.1 hypothetical protein [Flavobacterium chungbukense]
MKKIITLLLITLLSATAVAQTKMKPYKAGHVFDISLPDYMNKTVGLNEDSAIEYESEVKELYGFVIYDLKEDLKLVELNFNSAKEFYDGFMKDFLKEDEKKSISDPVSKKINDITVIETDVHTFDKEANMEIYYLIGVVETKKAFYKVLSWSAKENKDKFKGDFQKILYSIKD